MHLSHFDILATFLPELQSAKVQFFKDITKNLNVFLTMLPFLYYALVEMFTSLMHEYGYQAKCFGQRNPSSEISQN